MKLSHLLLSGGLLFGGACSVVLAQIAPARTWPELQQAVQERANAQRYPMTGFDAKQVAEILQRIHSLDRDEWARSWIQTGNVHAHHAQSLSASQPALAAEAYLSAWRYYGFGAWPTQNAPEKARAHALGTKAFRAYVALDMLGTGESPIKIDVGAERIFSRVIDALQSRTDLDTGKIGFQGVSWGGHWAARMAYAEPQRLKAVVNWGGPVHAYFQKDWQTKALGTREYLFDLFQARAAVYGVNTLDEFFAYGPRMSLKDAQALNKPSAPQLLVNGQKDSQVPIDDLYLVLQNGTAKQAWVNPEGGHLGRDKQWPDGRIFSEVIVPWFSQQLK